MSNLGQESQVISNAVIKPLWFLSDWVGVSDFNDWRSNLYDTIKTSESVEVNPVAKVGFGSISGTGANKAWKSIFADKVKKSIAGVDQTKVEGNANGRS